MFNNYFWQFAFKAGDNLKLVGKETSSPFVDGKDRDQLTGFVGEYMRELNSTPFDEFCYRLDHLTVVEPSLSYSIIGINKIIRASVTFTTLKPSTLKYLTHLFLKKGRDININAAVLFDGKLGENYFHFFADVFNKIWLLDYYNIDKNTPLIISRSTFQTKYFQYLYQHPRISCFNWLIQEEDDFIKCKTLFFIKPAPYNKPLWNQTLALLENVKSPTEPFRRLFITRPYDKPRGVSNLDSLIPILKKHGFDIIDPGSLTFEEQIRIFSEAHTIIGVHGAALTNIIFAPPGKLRVLEIGPIHRITGQFYWLALMLNIKYYNCILGTELVNSKFEIAIDVFENALAELLQAE